MWASLFLCFLLGKSCQSFSVGPPPLPAVCKTMNPQHHDYKAQGSESPYVLTVDRTEIGDGDSVQVSLATTDPATKMIGFYLQARNEEDQPLGTFVPNKHTKVHNCFGVRHNAAHHADGNVKKENVTMTWNAPWGYEGEIVMTATGMRDFVTYWVFIQSEPIAITKRSAGPPSNGYNRFQTALALGTRQGVVTTPNVAPTRPIFPNVGRIFQSIGGRLRLNSIFSGFRSNNGNRRTSSNATVNDAVGDSSSGGGRRSLCDMHILKRLFCNIFNYD